MCVSEGVNMLLCVTCVNMLLCVTELKAMQKGRGEFLPVIQNESTLIVYAVATISSLPEMLGLFSKRPPFV